MSSRSNLAGVAEPMTLSNLPDGVDGGRSGHPQQVAPGSPAPHAPPALTFGRPGKQKVKQVRVRDFLSRLSRALSQIVKYFTGVASGGAGT
jgi:hypothetical protein